MPITLRTTLPMSVCIQGSGPNVPSQPSLQGPWSLMGNRGTQDPAAMRTHPSLLPAPKCSNPQRKAPSQMCPEGRTGQKGNVGLPFVVLLRPWCPPGSSGVVGGGVTAFQRGCFSVGDNVQPTQDNMSGKGVSLSLCSGMMAGTQEQGPSPLLVFR